MFGEAEWVLGSVMGSHCRSRSHSARHSSHGRWHHTSRLVSISPSRSCTPPTRVLVGKASQMRFSLSSQTGSDTTKGGYVNHEGDDPRVDSGHG